MKIVFALTLNFFVATLAQAALPNASGLFFSTNETNAWRTAYAAYPAGNDLNNLPGNANRIKIDAQSFLAAPLPPVLAPPIKDVNNNKEGVKLVRAGFHYLMTGDELYAQKVESFLNAQMAALPNIAAEPMTSISNDFGHPGYFTRVFMAYDFTKHSKTYTTTEKTAILNWFKGVALYYQTKLDNSMNSEIGTGRFSRIFSNQGALKTLGWHTSKFWGDVPELTHVNADGSAGYLINGSGAAYTNRSAAFASFVGLMGVALKDVSLRESGVTFCEELISLGTNPDGTLQEYIRNGSWCTTQQGLGYSAFTIDSCVKIADALSRSGDTYLHELTKNFGMWGTEGGDKSLRKTILTHTEQVAGVLNRKAVFKQNAQCQINCPQPPLTVDFLTLTPKITGPVALDDRCKIDMTQEYNTAGQTGRDQIIASDLWFQSFMRKAPDALYTQVVTRELPGLPAWPNYGDPKVSVGTALDGLQTWGGSVSEFPEISFMYGIKAPSGVYKTLNLGQVKLQGVRTGPASMDIRVSFIGPVATIASVEIVENKISYSEAVDITKRPKDNLIAITEKIMGTITSPGVISVSTTPGTIIRGRVLHQGGFTRSSINDLIVK